MAIFNSIVDDAGPTTLFTASTGTEAAITTILFCNTDLSTDITLDVFVVPYGSVADYTNQIIKAVTIPATETFIMDSEKLILGSQDSIQAQVTAGGGNTLCATVSVVQL